MKKKYVFLFCLITLLFLTLLVSAAETDIPNFLKPSWSYVEWPNSVAILDENQKEIKEWVKNHSWEETLLLTNKTHTKVIGTYYGSIFANLYTPIHIWIENNYIGDQKFWDEKTIEEEFQKSVIPSSKGITFILTVSTNKVAENSSLEVYEKAAKKATEIVNNLKFGLEDNIGNRWKSEGSILEKNSEMQLYRKIFVFFEFDFLQETDLSKFTLHAIRTDKVHKDTFTWDLKND